MSLLTFQLIVIACLAGIVVMLLRKVIRIINGKERYSYTEKKTIDTYKYLPKAGDKKMLLLTIVLMLLIGAISCSPKGTLNCGSKYKLIAPKFKA
jgi:ABC-type phosphate transport system permease subunit